MSTNASNTQSTHDAPENRPDDVDIDDDHEDGITLENLQEIVDIAWDYFRRTPPFGGPECDEPVSQEIADQLKQYMLNCLRNHLYDQRNFPGDIDEDEEITLDLFDDNSLIVDLVESIANPRIRYNQILRKTNEQEVRKANHNTPEPPVDATSTTNQTPAHEPCQDNPNKTQTSIHNVHDVHTVHPLEHKTVPVQWLWHPYIPLSHITLVAGRTGIGKTTIATAVAAHATNGTLTHEPTNVLYIAPAEDKRSILIPRFLQNGGDPARLHFAEPQTDLDQTIHDLGIQLVIIDAAQPYLDGLEIRNAAARRNEIARLQRIAANHECAIIITANQTRATAADPLHTIEGAKDLCIAARSILLAQPSLAATNRGQKASDAFSTSEAFKPDSTRLLHIKSNLAPAADPLAFRIDDSGLSWLDYESIGADLPIAPPMTQLQQAIAYLNTQLSGGPQLARDLYENAPCSPNTLREAKSILRITATKTKGPASPWQWELSTNHANTHQSQSHPANQNPGVVTPCQTPPEPQDNKGNKRTNPQKTEPPTQNPINTPTSDNPVHPLNTTPPNLKPKPLKYCPRRHGYYPPPPTGPNQTQSHNTPPKVDAASSPQNPGGKTTLYYRSDTRKPQTANCQPPTSTPPPRPCHPLKNPLYWRRFCPDPNSLHKTFTE